MKDLLDALQNQIAQFDPEPGERHELFDNFVRNCTVVLTAGGEGSRFRKVTGDVGVHKTSYVLPNGETMIERVIKMYRDIGIRKFTALVFHHADSIVNLLGDGSRLGVSIEYSEDPERPVGRGGALKNAIALGKIGRGGSIIVHNPDDQIVGDSADILQSAISHHLYYVDRGALATAVVVHGTPYSFTGMRIERGKVVDISMYPFIPIPTHIGMTIFSPAAFSYIDRLFSMKEKVDFESVLFPVLKSEGKLFACRVPLDAWVSVNDEKGLKKLVDRLAISD